jgi:hypothetical protein
MHDMNQIEVMRQALEALEIYGAKSPDVDDTITALRLAIEQAEKQEHHAASCALLKIPSRDCDCQEMREPVAWRYKWPWNDRWHLIEEASEKLAEIAFVEPLYTAPPQRQPLTEDEIALISAECALATPSDIYFARAIERKHGIGGEHD